MSESGNPDDVLSRMKFDAHRFSGLPLEERVRETELEITEVECEDYLKKFGYMVLDCRGLRGESHDLCIAHSLRMFQHKMEIKITGEQIITHFLPET